MGRPKLPDDQARRANVHIRIPAALKEAVDAIAKDRETTITALIEQCLRKLAEKAKKGKDR